MKATNARLGERPPATSARHATDALSSILTALIARRRLLQMHFDANVGHIGGNLSVLDCLLYLHGRAMDDNDVFVLSKGHAAGALYIALWSIGLIDEEQLASFHKDNTLLAGHPVAGWHKRISFATGSLGHGLSLAAGVAIGKRLRCEAGHVYCLLSDGECQEGSIWEAMIFARHQKLSNLTVLVDANGLQGFGTTAEVATLEPLLDRVAGFGLDVVEIDGHSANALAEALRPTAAGPKVIILRTIKGHGISFMENKMEWHYLPLDRTHFEQAQQELAARGLAEIRRAGTRLVDA